MEIEFQQNNIFIHHSALNDKIHLACFGYELNNVNKDADLEPDVIIKRVFVWNKRLFDAISNNPINCSVVCKVRKNDTLTKQPDNAIRIALLFYVKSNNKLKLIEETRLLSEELTTLFTTASHDSTAPYLFDPIANRKHLNDFTSLPVQNQIFDYMRKPVNFKRSEQAIGYKSINDQPDILSFIPQFFIPDLSSFGNVAQIIANARVPIDLSIFLIPVKLHEKDLKDFKKVIKKYQLLDEHFTKHEKETYLKHLEILFDDNTNHFLFHVQLTAPASILLGHSMHNTIAGTFFGNILNVEIADGKTDKLTSLLEKNDTKSYIPYLYPQEIVQYCFRLPISSGDDIHWFSHQTNIHNYFPSAMPTGGILMGVKKFVYMQKEVRMLEQDLARHAYIMGQTGVGKTTLMKTMIIDHIQKGHGVCVVDPHGDLITSIYKMIPYNRMNDVIYFNPTVNHDVKINILEYNKQFPEQRTFIFNELIKILDELYDLRTTGGPMFELYFKNALFLIMEVGGTLADFYRFYFDSEFRKLLLENSRLNDCIRFFNNALDLTGEQSFNNFAGYITSKVNRFVQDDFIAPLINEKKSTINFRNIIDTRKILLVRLPKGRLGSDGVKFIGTLLFNRIIMAALTRENINPDKRIPFYMYIDEFQNFTSGDIETALSESRKYGLSLIMANQTLSQLKKNIEEILLSNVGSQVFFRPGPNVISKLRPYFQDYITEQEFVYLSNFKAFARLMCENQPLKPFIFETISSDQ